MSPALAFYGGLLNFFSIWILCLLQIVPFLFSYMVGMSLAEIGESSQKEKFTETLTVVICSLSGFGFLYCSLGASTTRFASFLFLYQSLLLQIGGVLLFLCSAYFLGILKVPDAFRLPLRFIGSFLAGAILGLAYQPCVTPALSAIYNAIKRPGTFPQGFTLLVFYTLGLLTALGIVGYGMVFLFSLDKLKILRKAAVKFCGLALLFISALLLLQKMTVYKSMLVRM
ncbi:MAG: hypothetical protein HZA01_12880 [Nitrospinae bacterium]|nr:hypothetical protein [Nitrospinota bacterium]